MRNIDEVPRVLVVDDSEANLRAVGRCFRNTNYELLFSSNSRECILTAVKELPDVILLDVLMPDVDGFAVCGKLKKIGATKDIPVIFMTGLDGIETKARAFEVGGVDFITKPFEPHEVMLRVGNQIKLINAKKRLVHSYMSLEQIVEVRTKALKSEVCERKKSEDELEKANIQLKENQSRLVQTEKLAGIGQLAAGVAHEINNPIGYINCNLGTLSDYTRTFKKLISLYKSLADASKNGHEEQVEEIAEQIALLDKEEDIEFIMDDVSTLLEESIGGVDKVSDIVQGLKSFARSDSDKCKSADINCGIESTLKLVWNELKYKCEIVKKLGDIPQIQCHMGKLNQVFLNLLVNASHSIEEQGVITIETSMESELIHIKISDTGCGIASEYLDKMFDPFFTTKPVGVGTGLGLAISHGIITEHGGTIDVKSELGEGTEFLIKLPVDS